MIEFFVFLIDCVGLILIFLYNQIIAKEKLLLSVDDVIMKKVQNFIKIHKEKYER